MLVDDMAKMVHENAVDHGWWDGERNWPEIISLIHSEWSEALEEARKGNPLAYVDAYVRGPEQIESVMMKVERDADGRYVYEGKEVGGRKPEGVAIELMDGVIRILDLFGSLNYSVRRVDGTGPQELEELSQRDRFMQEVPQEVSELVAVLHVDTSMALCGELRYGEEIKAEITEMGLLMLEEAMSMAMSWVKDHGMDPMGLLIEKHAYNIGRPYKHGKNF